MMPICAAALPCTLTTRATIVPSPASGWYTKWTPSALVIIVPCPAPADRQHNVTALLQSHGLARAQLRPVHAIGRVVHDEHVPAPRQLDPIQHCRPPHRLVGAAGAIGGALGC